MADDFNQKKQSVKNGAESDFCELDKTVVRVVSLEETQGDDSAPPATLPILPIDAGGKGIIGTTVAGISIKSLMGSGGMSCVYRGEQLGVNREVAVKMMHAHLLSDDTALLRFNQEAQAVGKLDHPNIVKVHDFRAGENGNSFLVMDLIEGKSLSDVIADEHVLDPERAIEIFSQACDGLQHAHVKGIVHRDLKPSNIMIVKATSDEEQVKVLDFGIAKILPREGDNQLKLTQTGEVFGSPLYMSPEQCMGRAVDQRSDVYAMGCMIYESLTGKPPFEGANAFDTFFKHTTEMPRSIRASREDFPQWREFDAIILKAMAKNPKDRYPSMTDLKIDLTKLRTHSDRGWAGRVADDAELARRRFGAQSNKSVKSILTQIGYVCVVLLAIAAGDVFVCDFISHHAHEFRPQSFDALYLSGQESFDRGDYAAASKQFESALVVAKLDKSRMLPVLEELVDLQIAQGLLGSGKYESKKADIENERDQTISEEINELVTEFEASAKSSDPNAKEKLDSLAQEINDKINLLMNPGIDARRTLENALKKIISTFEVRDKSEQKLGYARALHNYAESLLFDKRWKEAIPFFEKAAEIKKSLNSQDPANLSTLLQTLDSMARAYSNMGDQTTAEKIYKQRIDEARKTPIDGNNQTVSYNPNVAYGKFALAKFYNYSKHDPKAARANAIEALRIYEQTESPEPEDQAECCALLGVIDLKGGNSKSAEDYFLRARQLFEPLHHKRSLFWLETLRGLAECAFAKKDYNDAESLYRRTLAVAINYTPQFTPIVDQALKGLEEIAQARGNVTFDDLKSLGQMRLQIDVAQHGVNSKAVIHDYVSLFELARRFNEMELAKQFLFQASAILEKTKLANSWDGATVLFQQAKFDFDSEKRAEGEVTFEKLVSLVEGLKADTNTDKQLLKEIRAQLTMRMPKDLELINRAGKLIPQ